MKYIDEYGDNDCVVFATKDHTITISYKEYERLKAIEAEYIALQENDNGKITL